MLVTSDAGTTDAHPSDGDERLVARRLRAESRLDIDVSRSVRTVALMLSSLRSEYQKRPVNTRSSPASGAPSGRAR